MALRARLPLIESIALPPRAPGPRPLLMALHGWLLSGRLWDPLRAELGDRWDVWAPDLPGFGRTPRPRDLLPNLPSYGRWVAEAARERAEGRPVVLLGHSLGGSLALEAAPHLGPQLLSLVQVAVGGGVYQPRPFRLLRQVGSVIANLSALVRGDRRAARGLLACSTRRPALRRLPRLCSELAVPSLWIAGGRDRVMAPAYVRHLAGYSPLHCLAAIETAGHLPMRQAPAELARLIDPWVESLCSDQSAASPRS